MSHYGAEKQTKKIERGRRKVLGEGDTLKIGRAACNFVPQRECPLFIATDANYNILRLEKYSHEFDLGTTDPDTIAFVQANQGDGRMGQDRHDEKPEKEGPRDQKRTTRVDFR